MNIDKFLTNFNDLIKYKQNGNETILTLPIMFKNGDHYISVSLTEDNDNIISVSDRGEVFNYLDENGIDTKNYLTLIKKLCCEYDINIENNQLVTKLASYKTNQTMRSFTSFLGVLSFISNLDIFEI